MSSIKNCTYNLRGTGSKFDQPAPYTTFKHKSRRCHGTLYIGHSYVDAYG